jgi:hypothetical protein
MVIYQNGTKMHGQQNIKLCLDQLRQHRLSTISLQRVSTYFILLETCALMGYYAAYVKNVASSSVFLS